MELTDDGFVGGGVGAVQDATGEQAASVAAEGKPQVATARTGGGDTIIYAVAAAAAAGLIGGVGLTRGGRSGADRPG